MNTHADKTQENQKQSLANEVSQKQSGGGSTFRFVDDRPEFIAQRKLKELANTSPEIQQSRSFEEMVNSSPKAKQAIQLQAMADNYAVQQHQNIQKKENKTGLPDKLKSGIENLSGYSMDDVKVYYNSDKPAQLQAHAYAQGTDIHLSSGQKKHLPHEAWHVVQQKQGRVKPTFKLKGQVNVNDDDELEKEADLMGQNAMNVTSGSFNEFRSIKNQNSTAQLVRETTQVYGVTHLVRMIDGSLYSEDFESNEYIEVSDEDLVEIESDVSVFSRRGPNQEEFSGVDKEGPRHYLWYLVRSVNGKPVHEHVFIREDTFHKVRVKPTAETVGHFFDWLKGGREIDLTELSVDKEKLKDNRADYLREFKARLIRLNPGIEEGVIEPLFDDLIEIFVQKDVGLAKKFLADLTSIARLKPLEEESERLYWSGKESRKTAYETSKPAPGATALEKTEIGQLLDKFPLFDAIPWDLSTILWAEVSRCFSVGARGTMNVFIDGGFAKGNVFWNDELPALRLMQNFGLVDNIVIHIWHTRDKRWVKEFDITSEDLKMVFNKAIRIPAPTPEKHDNTRSYRYDNPIKVSVVTRILMRYLKSLRRDKPLIFHNFRLATGVFADAVKTDYGMQVSFFNYGSEAKKIAQIDARDGNLEKIIKSAEFYLMANATDYETIPRNLVFSEDQIRSGDHVIATKVKERWKYS